MATAIGRIESIEGSVEVLHADGSIGVLLQGTTVYANDVFTTDGNSNLRIRFLDGSGMNIDPESSVTMNEDAVNPGLIPEDEGSSQVILDASDRLITLDSGHGTAGTVEKTGTVETIEGVVVALEDNGTIRVLKSGDPLYASDVIRVNSNGDVSIRMIDGSLLSFGPDTTARLEDSAPSLPTYFAESGLTDPVQIQTAIQEGRDPSQVATAPTAGVPGSNEGGIPVILSSSSRAVTPDSGHDTHGFELPFRILEQDLLEGLAPDLPGEEGELTASISAIQGGTAVEGTPVTFEVSLDKLSEEATTVVVNVFSDPNDDDAAIQGTDYAATTQYTVVIAAGSLSNTFTVDTIDDEIVEGDETFCAQIDTVTNPSGPVVADPGIATGTITDNDMPMVSLSAIQGGMAVEGNPVTFEVSMDTLSDEDTTVVVDVFSGPNDDAIQGTDYAATTQYTVVIAAGTDSSTFTVDTLDDAIFEGDETFSAQIFSVDNPNGMVLVEPGTATIIDNDTPQEEEDLTVSISAIEGGTAVEGSPVTFEVSLDTLSDEDTTVVVNVFSGSGDDATQGTDYAATAQYTVVIAAGSVSNTFTVDTIDDAAFEAAETFSAQIDTATNPNGTVNKDPGIATGTIIDNEPGLTGGHFDVDTYSSTLPTKSDGHIHEYDDKFDTNIIDAFNFEDDKLHNIQEDIDPDDAEIFRLVVVNGHRNAGGDLEINGVDNDVLSYGYKGEGSQLYTLNAATAALYDNVELLTSLSITYDEGAILDGGLRGTVTGDVKKNELSPEGELRTGALSVMAVEVTHNNTTNGNDLIVTDGYSLTTSDITVYDQTINVITDVDTAGTGDGVLWETSVFWHWSGGTGKDYGDLTKTLWDEATGKADLPADAPYPGPGDGVGAPTLAEITAFYTRFVDGVAARNGSTGDDLFIGGGDNDTLDGGAGEDLLLGGSGNDILVGGSGDDLLSGGRGSDSMTGGDENDTFLWFEGETGTDTITDFNTTTEEDVLNIADLLNDMGALDGLSVPELVTAIEGNYLSIATGTNTTVSVFSDGGGGTADQVIELTGYNTTGQSSAEVIESLLGSGSDNLIVN
jgi:hypothetical protein